MLWPSLSRAFPSPLHPHGRNNPPLNRATATPSAGWLETKSSYTRVRRSEAHTRPCAMPSPSARKPPPPADRHPAPSDASCGDTETPATVTSCQTHRLSDASCQQSFMTVVFLRTDGCRRPRYRYSFKDGRRRPRNSRRKQVQTRWCQSRIDLLPNALEIIYTARPNPSFMVSGCRRAA